MAADRETVLRELHASLDRRRRPEDVARLVLDGFADLYTPAERATVRRAAAGGGRWPSMTDDFARPSGLAAQLAVAAELFAAVPPRPAGRGGDPYAVGEYLAAAAETIGKRVGANDFRAECRRSAGAVQSR